MYNRVGTNLGYQLNTYVIRSAADLLFLQWTLDFCVSGGENRRPSYKEQQKNRMETTFQIIFILLLSICSAEKNCYYKNVSILTQQNKTLSFNGSPYNCKCVDDNDGNVPYLMCTKDSSENATLNMIIIQNQPSSKAAQNDSSKITLQEKNIQQSNNSVVQADGSSNSSVSNSNKTVNYCKNSTVSNDTNVSPVTDTQHFNFETEDKAPESNVSTGNNLEVTNDTAVNTSSNSIQHINNNTTEILNSSVKTGDHQLVNASSNVTSSFSKKETESKSDNQVNMSTRGNTTRENGTAVRNSEETTMKNVSSSDGKITREIRTVNDSNIANGENVEKGPNSTSTGQGQNISMTQHTNDTDKNLDNLPESSTVKNFVALEAESFQEELTNISKRGDMPNKTATNETINNDQQTINGTTVQNDSAEAVTPNTKSKIKNVNGSQYAVRSTAEISNPSAADETKYKNNKANATVSNKTNAERDNGTKNGTNFSTNTTVAKHNMSSPLMSNLNLVSLTLREILSLEITTQANNPTLMKKNNISKAATGNVSLETNVI
ncbi:Hypothetical predicted protein [Octopus vulgaris]|uniref:Uncharacterized protein n=2 Tax=Octopus vulgaris TaxID=6645 RepID=A0AA36AL09_OCTVU|nr:Hypothetical predicted protein [Octopus vulgaris]